MAIGTLARRALTSELAQYRSLARWITRRPDVPPGAEPFPYIGAVVVVLWAFILGSAVELVVLHVILPWERIRLAADILSVWGLVWMLGLMAGLRVHPHLVTDAGLRVRNGPGVDLLLRWENIASVRTQERSRDKSRSVQLDEEEDGTVLSVPVGSRTNVDVVLRHHVPWRGSRLVDVRLFADDPRGLTEQAQLHLDRSRTTNSRDRTSS